MKIKSAHIDGFGKWQDVDFDFTANPQVIFGPNEAGKTTLAHFIESILFGFANGRGKNRYEQYKPKHGGSYGGSLTLEIDGKEYRVNREPGKGGGKVKVTGPDEQSGGKQLLSQLLGPIDHQLYDSIYSFSAQDLAAVDSVNRQELSQELRQMGAAGSRQWLAKSDQLKKTADTIYLPRGHKWPLNRELKSAQALDEKIQVAQDQSVEYEKKLKDQQSDQKELGQVHRQLADLQQKNQQLQHLRQLWPVYQSWLDARDQSMDSQISDEEVAAVSRLRVQEQTLQQTQSSQRSTVSDEKAELGGLEDADLEFYRQHEPDLQAARNNGMRLQAELDDADRAGQTVQLAKHELNQLEEKYETKALPLPLSDHDREKLEGLLGSMRKDQAGPSTAISRPLVVAGLFGILVGLVGLDVKLPILTTVGFVVAIAAAADVGLRSRRQSQEAADRQRRLNRALRLFSHDHQLESYPADSWLMMQGDLRRGVELQKQIDDANQKVQLTRQRVSDTMAEFSRFGKQSLTEWLANLTSFANRMAKRDMEERAVSQRFQTASANLQDTTDRLNKVTKAKLALYHKVAVNTNEEFDQLVNKRAAVKTNQAAAKGYKAQISDQDRHLLSQYASQADLEQDCDQAAGQLTDLRAREQVLDDKVRQAKVDLEALVKDGTLSDLQQQRADLATQIWDDTADWLAHQLAMQWIDRALSKASAGRFPDIIRAAKGYFATLTGHRYATIKVSDDGVAVVDTTGTEYAVPELSQGTAEQLYVALRLGFARVMSQTIALPLLIDDGFVNFDNVRRSRMIELLGQVAKSNQVLYFTADDRIKQTDWAVLDLSEMGEHDESRTKSI